MGGYGSGRTGGRPTIGASWSYRLSAKGLGDRLGWRGCTFKIPYAVGGDRMTLEGELDLPRLLLRHRTRCERRERVEYCVWVVTTPMRFGGVRRWFLCPLTRRRCAVLYLPLGGRVFASREAHGLVYDSRNMDLFERRQRRAEKLLRRLGEPGACWTDWPGERPRGMHQRTFDRLCAELAQTQDEGDGAWHQGAQRILARCGRFLG